MTMFNPFETSTVAGVAKAGKALELSHATLHLKSSFVDSEGNKVLINYHSLLDKYNDFLKKIIVPITFTEEEYLMYRFQPKRFCLEYYNTTELWSSILRINFMTSSAQFSNQTINAFTQDIFDVINEIMILEDANIKENKIKALL